MSEERSKIMDKLIAQDADLIDKLRDEDSYYRLQEKHWCIDSEELERQRLAAADRIEQLEREKAVVSDLWEQQKEIALDYLADCNKAADRIEALEAENERLRSLLKPQWFYAGEDQSSDQCRFSIDEVIEEELCGWGPPKTGKHVVHVSTALPGPDIWVAVHVFTDEEKDERNDDETWAFEEFSTETEARAALAGDSHDQ